MLCMCVFFFFFFFKQKTAYEMLRSLVGSEMCIRDRYTSWASSFSLSHACCPASARHSSNVCPANDVAVPMQVPVLVAERRLVLGRLFPFSRQQIRIELGQHRPTTPSWAVLVKTHSLVLPLLSVQGPSSLAPSVPPVSYTHLTLPTKRIV
eukprot:TRINITY_DN1780_c0_g1_i10.p1 TRINITY_DN1780_c0_g1~~TRINITY_DN1780_c0_g1_i10.p1  ORF type:complete len:151 (-),score=44.24 TRINITY_DN1780_c0_g1_i10:145-597(-)